MHKRTNTRKRLHNAQKANTVLQISQDAYKKAAKSLYLAALWLISNYSPYYDKKVLLPKIRL